MTNKEKLLQILHDFDVDELWVSFEDLYSEDHTSDNDYILAVKRNATYADHGFKQIWSPLMRFFASSFDDNDDAIAGSVYTTVDIVCGKEELSMQVFNRHKSKCHLVYTKGRGLIG